MLCVSYRMAISRNFSSRNFRISRFLKSDFYIKYLAVTSIEYCFLSGIVDISIQ